MNEKIKTKRKRRRFVNTKEISKSEEEKWKIKKISENEWNNQDKKKKKIVNAEKFR